MNKAIPIVLALAAMGAAGWKYDVLASLGIARDVDEEMVLYGNIDIRQVSLAFRVDGRIMEAMVDEGDVIKRGDLLARLDKDTYDHAVISGEANVAALRAIYEKLVAGPRQTEIAQARATHDASVADLQKARLAYDRAQLLRSRGTISDAGVDEATAARAVALARSNMTKEALAFLEEGSRSEDIATAAAQVKAAEAALLTARTSLSDTELRAPNDGVVLSRIKEPGAIVSSSDPVYVLSLTAPVWVRSYIGEVDLGRIYPGMKVKVASDTHPGKSYEGTIGFISPVAEFTPKSVETPELRTDLVYRIRVVIGTPGRDLRQGMPVTLRFPEMEAAVK
ncbi:secretion protein HlyD [Mycoplana rhizolycopersici]|uniref:Secretion protein HlyD n=1 Tax=Mycoplana rhizolycopersici TaxID=2746702 RepID=A0ABX2QKI9_9HYPH|nr:secretion protein HlyD [Rhizobium rhizolycopersici]NVP58299.1 secretion protein HlyD [Rhizobium rhizolycopersici]